MNTGEAICRAVANLGGYYEEGNDLEDDAYRELVATSPCLYPDPEDNDYPLGTGWEEEHPFLTRPYSWFLRLDESDQLSYLEHLDVGYIGGAPDVLKAMTEWVIDVEVASGKTPKMKKAADKWATPGRLVCTWPDLGATEQRVAFVMAAHGRDDGSNIFISQESIGEIVNRHRTTVYKAMKRLERAGVISMTEKARQHKPATYKLNRGPRVI